MHATYITKYLFWSWIIFLSACSSSAPDPNDSTLGTVDTGHDISDIGLQPADVVVASDRAVGTDPGPPNILLIIADDLGLEASACYGVGQNPALTPTIASLCARGVVFRNAWVNPVCSPTRASMLTGRYGFRTGIGRTSPPAIPATELTLPRAFDANPHLGYTHASVGKWHLGQPRGNSNYPNEMGWGHFSGLVDGVLPDYFAYTKVVDGQEVDVMGYATTETINDSIAWLDGRDGPWFLWVAFNAPHSPFHLPPADLHDRDELPGTARDIRQNPLPYFHASITAMDTEIRRLFDAIGSQEMENTYVVYLADNGSGGRVVQPPFDSDHAKGTIYNGGIHVPLIIAGPGLAEPGRHVDALVNGVDLFATILELAGVDVETTVPDEVTLDSVSMASYLVDPNAVHKREWIYSELFDAQAEPGDGRTIRGDQFKLIRFTDGTERLFDLFVDPYEVSNLLDNPLQMNAQEGYDQLSETMDDLLATQR